MQSFHFYLLFTIIHQEPDQHGIRPLLAAVWEGHTDCVEFLLSKVHPTIGEVRAFHPDNKHLFVQYRYKLLQWLANFIRWRDARCISCNAGFELMQWLCLKCDRSNRSIDRIDWNRPVELNRFFNVPIKILFPRELGRTLTRPVESHSLIVPVRKKSKLCSAKQSCEES